jgi:perosamine synthetase
LKIQRTIPPAAAPIDVKNIVYGLAGIFSPQRYLEKMEGELRSHFGVKHVFLASSGKAALTLILSALQSLCPGKKQVLIPAYTCFSVPSAIVKAGLEVSLCDIDDKTLDFDYRLLEETVNENTLCVVPSHLFGIPSDMDRIKSICERRGAYVVEDTAQAMGGTYKEKFLGTIGDVGFFSLGRGKNVTCGSGGIIVTNSDMIAREIKKKYLLLEQPGLRENLADLFNVIALAVFIRPSLYWFPSGLPFLKLGETVFYKDFPIKRLSGMKAGILRHWKKQLEESNAIRRKNAEFFRMLLGLNLYADISIPFLRLPLIVESRNLRDRIYSLAQKKGMGISFMYPSSIDTIEEIHTFFENKTFSRASDIANRILTLPTHQFLSERDTRAITEFLRKLIAVKK